MPDRHPTVPSGEHHFSRFIENARRYWKIRRKGSDQRILDSSTDTAVTITVSHEVGTQGGLVAQEVGKLLGWHVYDHELLEDVAHEMGVRTSSLEQLDGRKQSWLQESIGAYLTSLVAGDESLQLSESAFVYHLIEVVLALGAHGECVIVGRGAAFILPAETTLRVRLVGSVPERIATVSRKLAITEREASRRIRTLDRERNAFVQEHFLKDPADPRNHDLVLNVPRLSVPRCAEMIVEAFHRLPFDSETLSRRPSP
jgi:cytidylate kinase